MDGFAASFSLYIDWPLRLAKELPFLDELLRQAGARTVLDAGAGEGRHAAALARLGYRVAAFDTDEGLVERARGHAREQEQPVEVFRASFAGLPALGRDPSDAVLCLGNSLCMVGGRDEFFAAVDGLASAVRPGGLLLAHALNYQGLRKGGKRFGPPRSLDDGRLVLKMFDLRPGDTAVHIVVLRPGEKRWSLEHASHPLFETDLALFERALERAGLGVVRTFGAADGRPFEPERSYDLFVLGRRPA